MPTAAKMAAALLLAALAWLASDLIRPLMPDSTQFGWFNHVNAALGFVVGWRSIGAKAGEGLFMAISNGITGVAVLIFFGLFFHSLYEMLHLSMRRMYDHPLAGIEDMFRIGAEFGAVLLDPLVAGTLIAGGIAVAIIAELVNSIWR
ncbi:TrgA family protein [Thalassovita aquimarina]|uniref:TrgA family protein n=2 Tax=Thalassovita aquimarina TaxID=2785917 RepID=A0ABS5HL63_9RHOB|nr:TrgA family protein [Thalassovita aquimarina]MBR9649719.1 TrgA family protein [Thalassovita aquimarina]